MIQTVTVNSNSLAIFNDIPVGTFTLKEQKTSSDNFVLSEEIYTVESTKEGLEVFDSNETLIGIDEPIQMEVKNYIKKGEAHLSKTDIISGQPLSDTGVRILDQAQNIVIEGKTDGKGQFIFRQLPKGIYYFQEFEAPQDYQIDETPLKFQIKEDGDIIKVDMTNRKVSTPNTGETSDKLIYLVASTLSLLVIGLAVIRKYKKKWKVGSQMNTIRSPTLPYQTLKYN